jgi:circadian clock protein KaiC
LKGAPGAGKTVLSSQLSFHVTAEGGRALYVTLLSELHGSMIDDLKSFAFFQPAVVGRELKYLSLSGSFRDLGLGGLLQEVNAAVHQERPALMVLDGFLPLDEGGSTLTVPMFVQDLSALVNLVGATLLLTDSTPAGTHAPVHAMADGIIELDEALVEQQARRTLRVGKLRGGRHLGGLHPFTIDERGVRVSPRFERSGEGHPPAPPPSEQR